MGLSLSWLTRLFRRHVRADIKLKPKSNDAFTVRWVVGISRKRDIRLEPLNRFLAHFKINAYARQGYFQVKLHGNQVIVYHMALASKPDREAYRTSFDELNRAFDKAGF